MTAAEALREMRKILLANGEMLLAWADAIEAELKAKDAEIARLRVENGNLRSGLKRHGEIYP